MEGPSHEDLAITVLTCKGDLRDPSFPSLLNRIVCKLRRLVSDGKRPFLVTKIEPWNSVRVTFSISREAAQKLRQLAESGDNSLRDLGILSVQVEGDQVIALTLAHNSNETQDIIGKRNNESTQEVFSNTSTNCRIPTQISFNCNNFSSSISESRFLTASSSSTQNLGAEVSRRNIAQYLSHQTNKESESVAFKSPNVVAPKSGDPLPFLSSNNNTASLSVTPPPISSLTGSKISINMNNVNVVDLGKKTATTNRLSQHNVGPFPFASMQHAMFTKQGTNTISINKRTVTVNSNHNKNLSFVNVPCGTSGSNSPILNSNVSGPNISSVASSPTYTTTSSTSLFIRNPDVSDNRNISSAITTSSNQQQAQSVSVNMVPGSLARVSSASSNVALTSPLLVNLLQSDGTSSHMKMLPPPTQQFSTSKTNSINVDICFKKGKQQLKARKMKDKPPDDRENDSISLLGANLNADITKATITLNTSNDSLPSNTFINPSVVSVSKSKPISGIHSNLIHIPGRTIPRFPNINPEIEGQPGVVQDSSQLPSIGSREENVAETNIPTPCLLSSSETIDEDTYQKLTTEQEVTSHQPSSIGSSPQNPICTASSSTCIGSICNPQKKHLINPFTGLLEPLCSDEEEVSSPISSTIESNSDQLNTSEICDSNKNINSNDNELGMGKFTKDSPQSSSEVSNSEQISSEYVPCLNEINKEEDQQKIRSLDLAQLDSEFSSIMEENIFDENLLMSSLFTDQNILTSGANCNESNGQVKMMPPPPPPQNQPAYSSVLNAPLAKKRSVKKKGVYEERQVTDSLVNCKENPLPSNSESGITCISLYQSNLQSNIPTSTSNSNLINIPGTNRYSIQCESEEKCVGTRNSQFMNAGETMINVSDGAPYSPIACIESSIISSEEDFPQQLMQQQPTTSHQPSPIGSSLQSTIISVSSPSCVGSIYNPQKKHLINPFTGHLEQLCSDEEEINSPVPSNSETTNSNQSHQVNPSSEKSCDSSSKDNNHSSDTDSGIGKFVNDASSQSSSEVSNSERTPPSEYVPCLNDNNNTPEEASVEVDASHLELVDLTIRCEDDSLISDEELSLPPIVTGTTCQIEGVLVDNEDNDGDTGHSVASGDHNYTSVKSPSISKPDHDMDSLSDEDEVEVIQTASLKEQSLNSMIVNSVDSDQSGKELIKYDVRSALFMKEGALSSSNQVSSLNDKPLLENDNSSKNIRNSKLRKKKFGEDGECNDNLINREKLVNDISVTSWKKSRLRPNKLDSLEEDDHELGVAKSKRLNYRESNLNIKKTSMERRRKVRETNNSTSHRSTRRTREPHSVVQNEDIFVINDNQETSIEIIEEDKNDLEKTIFEVSTSAVSETTDQAELSILNKRKTRGIITGMIQI